MSFDRLIFPMGLLLPGIPASSCTTTCPTCGMNVILPLFPSRVNNLAMSFRLPFQPCNLRTPGSGWAHVSQTLAEYPRCVLASTICHDPRAVASVVGRPLRTLWPVFSACDFRATHTCKPEGGHYTLTVCPKGHFTVKPATRHHTGSRTLLSKP